MVTNSVDSVRELQHFDLQVAMIAESGANLTKRSDYRREWRMGVSPLPHRMLTCLQTCRMALTESLVLGQAGLREYGPGVVKPGLRGGPPRADYTNSQFATDLRY